MNGNIPSWAGVAASVGLVAICVGVIVREQLGLAREVVVSAVRAAVQLVAVGAVLGWLFDHAGLPGGLLWLTLMLLVGASVSGRRGRVVPGSRWVAFAALTAGVGATLGLLVIAQVIDTHPRVIVPVGGMVVAAATRGTSVVLLRLGEGAVASRAYVEARLALGLSAAEAFAPHRRLAQRTALITDIDAVKTVGLISLPGAMTGLLLAGVDPLTAIRYQVVVMYMILSAVAVSGAVAAQLGARRLFDDAERLVV
ncbi:MAG: iron export transporter permease subunit FetB [Frankiales bacterium]|nr:iron export transporter permease subunit FetB [Frankiales bacterium]